MTPRTSPDDELRNVIGRRGALIVVGTGVSIAASRGQAAASWSGLLKDGLCWLKEHDLLPADRVDAHLTLLEKAGNTHHLISAAQDVTAAMGGVESTIFENWLTRTVGSIVAREREGLDALEALRQHGHLLATTNYDGLLLNDGKLQPVTWKDPDALLGAARNRETEKIVFLHGYWRRPKSVILDWRSYQQITSAEEYRQDLAAVWQMTTWVYVGCGVGGLSDPDFSLLLERYGKRARKAGFWDYCLVRNGQREEFQAHFDENELNIRAVPYGESNEHLPGYLRSLLPLTIASTAPVPVVAQAPAEPITEFLRITDSFFQYRSPSVASGVDVSANRGDFRFSAHEFRSGAVHRAQAVELASNRLVRDGFVWLEGPSAGGKTTVSLHLVNEWNHRGCEPLYLDMADEPDAEQAAREISAHAKPGRMFVLDNVHDAPKIACALLDHWNAQRRESVMVMLGWPATARPGQDYLSGHRNAVVPVAVQLEDWIGVYQSAFRQIRGSGHAPPVPPPHVVKEWDDTFAANLVTFQYALSAGLRHDTGNALRIERSAADRYVREKYLDPCTDAERHDLFLLAWFAELGIALGEESAPSRFSRSLGCGLIRSTVHGQFKSHVRFQPWHRSFGRLLLGLAPRNDRDSRLCRAAASHPFGAAILAHRLQLSGEGQLATRVIERTLDARPNLADWFGDNLVAGAAVLRRIQNSLPAKWPAVTARLAESTELEKLVDQAFATPLNDLVTFLRFAAQSDQLKPLWAALVNALAADVALPADQSRVLAKAFVTPLGDLVTFLRFTAQSDQLKPVWAALVKALADDALLPLDQSRLMAQAFATPLHFLVAFLQFTAQNDGLKPVTAALVKALANDAALPADQSRLMAQAFATPPQFLVTFLQFTAQNDGLKPVTAALVKALIDDAALPADQSRLITQAFATPLHFLATFLRFARQTDGLNPVMTVLVRAMAADAALPADQSRLLHTARSTKYENLLGFVRNARSVPELAALVEAIERDGVCADVLRIRVQSSPPLPAAIQPSTGIAQMSTSPKPSLRSELEERIKAGIDKVISQAWEAIPVDMTSEDRFKLARKRAAQVIAGLSPHIRRQVGAHFDTQKWEPLRLRPDSRLGGE